MRFLIIDFEGELKTCSAKEFELALKGGLLDGEQEIFVSDVVHIVDTKENLVYFEDFDPQSKVSKLGIRKI